MKYCYALLAIVFFSCSKQDKVAPVAVNALIVNDVEFTPSTKFAVGQILNIKPSITNGAAGFNFTWTLTPNQDEVFQQVNSEFSWRPAKAQQYTLAVNATSASGVQAGKDYTFNLIPADIRYYLWGARKQDVYRTEAASSSDMVDEFEGPGDFVEYLVNHTEPEYNKRDAVQPGEYVYYTFENDKLVAADVYALVKYDVNPDVFYDKYEELKSRLSEYTYLGEENKWLSPELREQYANKTDRWGEALRNGYMTLKDKFENERTSITLETYPTDGDALIVIRYAQKR